MEKKTLHLKEIEKNKSSMRLGIICDDIELPKWQLSCIYNILEVENIDIRLFLLRRNNNRSKKLWQYFFNSFYGLSKKLSQTCNALEKVDIQKSFSDHRSISIINLNTEIHSSYFSDEDLNCIRDKDIDILFLFNAYHVNDKLIESSKKGIWYFEHGYYDFHIDTPPYFWEMYHNENITYVTLRQKTTLNNKSDLLKEGYFNTINYSYKRQLEQIYSEIARWPALICINAIKGNLNYSCKKTGDIKENRLYSTPNSIQILLFITRIIINGFIKTFEFLFRHDQWNIGIVNRPIETFLESNQKPQIQWLDLRLKNSYYADPFGVLQGDSISILFENFNHSRDKGDIYNTTFNINDLSISGTCPVFENTYHMSYPYIFEYENEIYCIPETYQNNEITLYKAVGYPTNWIKVYTILPNIAGIDATVFQYNDRWWLSFTDMSRGNNYILFIWYSSDLLGPWKPHLHNPVKIDIRSARPAGTPFKYKDVLYRPAQDCSKTYGGRIVINKVLKLSPTEFEEVEVKAIEPDLLKHGLTGLHTLSSVGNFILIDGKHTIFNFCAFRNALFSLSRKI